MRKLLFFTFMFTCCYSFGQEQKIRFDYDVAGNQTVRQWCPGCLREMSHDIKDISKLDDSDFKEFFPNDVISYYPNPVKEELFLKWKEINNNKVKEIQILNINGQILKSINQNLDSKANNVSFIEYPLGIYFLNLKYENGEQKSIKIIKN